jgi:PAS domain S-box-containing protein
MRPDGEIRHLHQRSQYVPVPSGQPTQAIVVIQDVTELTQVEFHLKKSREALEESEAMLTQSAAMAHLGHAIWNYVGEKYITVSEGWASIFGYTKEEFQAQIKNVEDDSELIHPADRDRYRAYYENNEEVPDIEYRIVRRDGKTRHVLQRYEYYFKESDEPTKALVTILDITDRKERENELNKARKEDAARAATLERLNKDLIQTQELLRAAQWQAVEANEAKSLFLAHMSHEIRSPLNVILTANTLLHESKLTAEQREYINLSHDGGQTLMALINDILDFSKIESGKLKLQYDWFNPGKTVEQVVKQLYGRAALKGIEVVSVISPLVPQMCMGDEIRFRQILINLVTNAIKFTDSGGTIVRLLPTEQGIEVQVEDSGIGIAADRQETIFDEFVQLDEGDSRESGGSGLGLSIISRLVELMKGEVILDSDEGTGSLFRILLPLQVKSSVDFITPLDSGQYVCLDVANPVLARGLREQISLMGGRACLLEDFLSEAPSGTGKCVMLVDHKKHGLTVKDHRRRIDRLSDAGNWRLATLVDMRDVGYLEQALTDGFDVAIRKPLRAADIHKHLFGSARLEADDGVATGPEIPGDTAVGEGKLVLLVEDSLSIQAVTRALLVHKGYDVAIADNGSNAVKMAAARPFDVILMDVAMPVMDGLTATRHLRIGNGPNRQTPIIAMTANAFTEDKKRCFDAGMDDFISKPLDVEKFYQQLEHWTGAVDTAPAQKATAESESDKQDIRLLAPDVLETLAENVSWDLLPNITSNYIKETEERVAHAEEHFSRGDLNSLAGQAHTIKSASANLGLLKLETLAAKIELAAKRGDLTTVADAMSSLEHLVQVSTFALKTFVKDHCRLSS